MQIDSAHVGTRLSPYRTAVDWRWMTNYAAAVGDANPCYFDDTRNAGLIAHPVFPVAVTWPVALQLDRYLEGSAFPVELMAMQVHHSEHIALHHPIRPGQRLTVAGTVAAIRPHRAGTRVILRYEASDEDGQGIFTEHIGGLLRGVSCTDEGRGLDDLPPDPPSAPEGASLWEAPVTVDPLFSYRYDAGSGIVFPIHTSPAFARSVGLPGIIVQGTATLALAVSELVNREADGDPQRITALACRFTGMVRPGTTIRILLQQRKEENLFFEVRDEQDKRVLSNGHARLKS
ncbi:MAG: MaoC family dehydratase N-terminal domain-containing protein [Deltaproteobacteria bacterium]|nr:MaoC family dehydratase N-terminal domain-containing protein [Deltaproteobacteria bacterium]